MRNRIKNIIISNKSTIQRYNDTIDKVKREYISQCTQLNELNMSNKGLCQALLTAAEIHTIQPREYNTVFTVFQAFFPNKGEAFHRWDVRLEQPRLVFLESLKIPVDKNREVVSFSDARAGIHKRYAKPV
jgi:hypothetical protein